MSCSGANFLVKSQLVVINLTRLEKTANLHGALSLLGFGFLSSLLTVLDEQLRIITSKLLELNQEVTQCELEAVDVVGLREQVCDELLNLCRCEVGEGVDKEVADKVLEELLVRCSSRCHVGSVDRRVQLARSNKVEHLSQEHGLVLEAGLVV